MYTLAWDAIVSFLVLFCHWKGTMVTDGLLKEEVSGDRNVWPKNCHKPVCDTIIVETVRINKLIVQES